MKQFETVTFKGTAVHTNGMMPQKGEMAPDFTAVAGDLSDLSLGSLKGKRVILNIFQVWTLPYAPRRCASSM